MSIWNLGGLLGGGKSKPDPSLDYYRRTLGGYAQQQANALPQYQAADRGAQQGYRSSIDRFRTQATQPGLNAQEQSNLGAQQAQNAWNAQQQRAQAAAYLGGSGFDQSSGYAGAMQGAGDAQYLANAAASRDAYNNVFARQQQAQALLPQLEAQYAGYAGNRYGQAQGMYGDSLNQLLGVYFQQQQMQQQQRQNKNNLLGQLAGAAGYFFGGRR